MLRRFFTSTSWNTFHARPYLLKAEEMRRVEMKMVSIFGREPWHPVYLHPGDYSLKYLELLEKNQKACIAWGSFDLGSFHFLRRCLGDCDSAQRKVDSLDDLDLDSAKVEFRHVLCGDPMYGKNNFHGAL